MLAVMIGSNLLLQALAKALVATRVGLPPLVVLGAKPSREYINGPCKRRLTNKVVCTWAGCNTQLQRILRWVMPLVHGTEIIPSLREDTVKTPCRASRMRHRASRDEVIALAMLSLFSLSPLSLSPLSLFSLSRVLSCGKAGYSRFSVRMIGMSCFCREGEGEGEGKGDSREVGNGEGAAWGRGNVGFRHSRYYHVGFMLVAVRAAVPGCAIRRETFPSFCPLLLTRYCYCRNAAYLFDDSNKT